MLDESTFDLGAHEAILSALKQEQCVLTAAGRWIQGPADLLGVIGRGRRETYHSALLAWLLDPTGRHRLGPAFLAAVLETCGLQVPDVSLTDSVAATEVSAAFSRADIVVEGPNIHLVIEVKVDASEGELQCQRLYDDHQGPTACFVFLTPTGRAPRSCAEAIVDEWIPLSFRWVEATLRGLMKTHRVNVEADEDAQVTLRSYLATLRRVFGGTDQMRSLCFTTSSAAQGWGRARKCPVWGRVLPPPPFKTGAFICEAQ